MACQAGDEVVTPPPEMLYVSNLMHEKNRCVSIIVTLQRLFLSGVPDLRAAGCKRVTTGHVVATESVPCSIKVKTLSPHSPPFISRWRERREIIRKKREAAMKLQAPPPAHTHFDDEEEMEPCVCGT